MTKETKDEFVTTENSFIDGVFYPTGSPVRTDLSKFEKSEDEDAPKSKTGNLVPAGKVEQAAPVVIAPIAPTGPNPTKPQQLPADAVQQGETYVIPGNGETKAAEVVGEAPVKPSANRKGSAKPKH